MFGFFELVFGCDKIAGGIGVQSTLYLKEWLVWIRAGKFDSYSDSTESICATGGIDLEISLWSEGRFRKRETNFVIVCGECLANDWR